MYGLLWTRRARGAGDADGKRGTGMAITISVGDGLSVAFATPLLQLRNQLDAATNQALVAAVLAREGARKGITRSNVGGWHSEDDLFEWREPAIGALKRVIGEGLKRVTSFTAGKGGEVSGDFSAVAWANVNRKGDFNRLHNHPGFVWSGVYYAQAGDAPADRPDSGLLELVDPRVGVDMIAVPGDPYGGAIAVKPEDGMLVMFPSWLQHSVAPYRGEVPRISIAFNVAIHNVRVHGNPR
jgi:uncharacterized protein (TIGR02466 family)